MISKVMMVLGGYPFMVETAAYTQLKRSHAYRWKKVDRIGRKPAQQYLGPDAGKITLSGEILPHWQGGLHQVTAMRAQAGRGKPLLLIDGNGFVWDDWCITKIDETGSEFFSDGTPRVIHFSISLVEYGDDQSAFGGLSIAVGALSALSRLV